MITAEELHEISFYIVCHGDIDKYTHWPRIKAEVLIQIPMLNIAFEAQAKADILLESALDKLDEKMAELESM